MLVIAFIILFETKNSNSLNVGFGAGVGGIGTPNASGGMVIDPLRVG